VAVVALISLVVLVPAAVPLTPWLAR